MTRMPPKRKFTPMAVADAYDVAAFAAANPLVDCVQDPDELGRDGGWGSGKGSSRATSFRYERGNVEKAPGESAVGPDPGPGAWTGKAISGEEVKRRGPMPSAPMLLMVAEKPSIAQTLSQALSGGEPVSKRRGSSPFSPVYEYEGTFGRTWASFRVTAVTGHVFNRDFTPEFNDWRAHEPRELFEAPTELKEADPRSRMVSHLRQEAKGCHGIVLWLDCDREGENICFEVLSIVYERLARPWNIYRAKFSSLHPPDLRNAMLNLVCPSEDEAKSVEARQEIDLKLGVSFTRFLTMYLKQNFKHVMETLDLKVVSYGPCQAPTLWFCVKRQNEIFVFVPEPFWVISVEVRDNQGPGLWFKRKKGCFWEEPLATALLERLRAIDSVTVAQVEERRKSHRKPLPLNTVALLQKASQKLRMGPARALEVAESLYLAGMTTYPRTETNKYASSFDPAELLGSMAERGDGHTAQYAQQLLQGGASAPRADGHDAGDHPPITPVRGAAWKDFRDNSAYRLYELIAQHFLASISPDAETKEVSVTLPAAGEDFVATGSQVVDLGWTAAYGPKGGSFLTPGGTRLGARLERLRQGQRLQVVQATKELEHTEPPGLVTESELLGLMESHGIGTDASMATHIETVVKRSYCELEEEKRTLRPTPLGRAVCHSFVAVDGDYGLCAPPVRASIERDCDKVARGEEAKEAAVTRALRLFTKKYERFTTQAHVVPLMLAAAFAEAKARGKAGRGGGPGGAGAGGAGGGGATNGSGAGPGSAVSAASEMWNRAVESMAALRLEDLKKHGGRDSDVPPPLPTVSVSEWQMVKEAREALAEVGFTVDAAAQASAERDARQREEAEREAEAATAAEGKDMELKRGEKTSNGKGGKVADSGGKARGKSRAAVEEEAKPQPRTLGDFLEAKLEAQLAAPAVKTEGADSKGTASLAQRLSAEGCVEDTLVHATAPEEATKANSGAESAVAPRPSAAAEDLPPARSSYYKAGKDSAGGEARGAAGQEAARQQKLRSWEAAAWDAGWAGADDGQGWSRGRAAWQAPAARWAAPAAGGAARSWRGAATQGAADAEVLASEVAEPCLDAEGGGTGAATAVEGGATDAAGEHGRPGGQDPEGDGPGAVGPPRSSRGAASRGAGGWAPTLYR